MSSNDSLAYRDHGIPRIMISTNAEKYLIWRSLKRAGPGRSFNRRKTKNRVTIPMAKAGRNCPRTGNKSCGRHKTTKAQRQKMKKADLVAFSGG